MIVAADDEHDRLVGFDTTGATVSVAYRIVVEGHIGLILDLVAAKIEGEYENVCIVYALHTAVSCACLYFVRHNHGILECHGTSCVPDVEAGLCQPSTLRIERHFEFDVVVRSKTTENSVLMTVAAAV